MSSYITMEELRSNSGLGDLAIDVEGQRAIDAAEESIEAYCNRFFYQSATATRYYTALSAGLCITDDIVSAATVTTDDDGDGTFETTWDAADYYLAPYNAAADAEPYTKIEASPDGTEEFSAYRRGVAVTGVFGWPAIPARVKQAVIIQATRYLKRARSSPFGIEAVTVDGTPIRLRKGLDTDVEIMLSDLRRHVVKVR